MKFKKLPAQKIFRTPPIISDIEICCFLTDLKSVQLQILYWWSKIEVLCLLLSQMCLYQQLENVLFSPLYVDIQLAN